MQPPYFIKAIGFMADIKKDKVSLSELYPAMCAMLDSGGQFLFYPDGVSMLPTIRAGRDGVLLSRLDAIRRGDILLFRRRDGSFVLHRLVKLDKNGTLVMRGDNQYIDEGGILPDAVIGKVSAIIKGERKVLTSSLPFRFRSGLRLFFYPVRRFFHRALGKIKRTLRRKH